MVPSEGQRDSMRWLRDERVRNAFFNPLGYLKESPFFLIIDTSAHRNSRRVSSSVSRPAACWEVKTREGGGVLAGTVVAILFFVEGEILNSTYWGRGASFEVPENFTQNSKDWSASRNG